VVELLGRLLAEPVTWLRALPGWLVLATAGTVRVRTLTPRLAGCSGMPYHRFARYSAPTAATWGATLVLLDTLSGDYSAPLLHWLGYGPAGALALLLVLGWWRYRRLARLPGRRRRGVPTAP